MPEREVKMWADFYRIYEKYRSIRMKDQNWADLVSELGACAVLHDYENNPLAFYLAEAVHLSIGEMYKGGKEPEQVSFLGRDDL